MGIRSVGAKSKENPPPCHCVGKTVCYCHTGSGQISGRLTEMVAARFGLAGSEFFRDNCWAGFAGFAVAQWVSLCYNTGDGGV